MQSHLKLFVVFVTVISVISGASYNGNTVTDATRYIVQSQGVVPFGYTQPGHPRGHAVGVDTGRFSINSVQDYSRDPKCLKYGKSGFLFTMDQDAVVHIALRHSKGRAAMASLNSGQNRVVLTLTKAELGVQDLWIAEWKMGVRVNNAEIRSVVIVLGHFKGQEKNVTANVHIQTAYPKAI